MTAAKSVQAADVLGYDLTFGTAARTWRNAAGLSLRDAAAQLDLSFTYLSKIETDEMSPPSENVLEGMATTYDVPRLRVFLLAKRIPSGWKSQLAEASTFYRIAAQLGDPGERTTEGAATDAEIAALARAWHEARVSAIGKQGDAWREAYNRELEAQRAFWEALRSCRYTS